jgi:hypothetical protein
VIELGNLLGYGISGLGLALAILAYRLLAAEQKIASPRSQIITAIYVFMVFSLVLTGGGLFFELKRLSSETSPGSQASLAPLPDDASDPLWFDVLKATRQKLFGNAPHREFVRGFLETGQSRELPIQIEAGDCRSYMAMTKPPARIEIAVPPREAITHTPLGREDHFAFGRICAAKAPVPSAVTLRVTMTKRSGPFVAEAYQ